MFTPDIRTILVSYLVINLVSILVLMILWFQTRKRYGGTGFWIAGFSFQTFALILISLRNVVPDWASYVLSNTMLISGFLLCLKGLELFIGKKKSSLFNIVIIVIYTSIQIWFTYYQHDLSYRRLIFSLAMISISSQVMWLAFFGVNPEMRKLTSGVGLIFGAFCFVSILRIVKFFIEKQPSTDLFQADRSEAFIIFFYQLLFFCLVFALTLMYNKRLHMDISGQEEKFMKAFQSSPYAVIISRISDGQIVEANRGFMKISGYSSSEVIGKKSQELGIWENNDDRTSAIEELLQDKLISEREYKFRKKSGEILTGLISMEIIILNNERYMISSINDITHRKSSEKLIAQKIEELEKFNRIMVGRENKMLELKQEINDLCTKMNLPPRYDSPSIAVKM
jgi:PAS domain S-box-containing protein